MCLVVAEGIPPDAVHLGQHFLQFVVDFVEIGFLDRPGAFVEGALGQQLRELGAELRDGIERGEIEVDGFEQIRVFFRQSR
jgi:hypothetical protein